MSIFPKKYQDLLDYKKLLKSVPDLSQLSVSLKKSQDKGVGLYATKPIKKGEIIAYYLIKIFKNKDYESPTDFVYSFAVYRKNGEEYKRLIGDIDLQSFPQPVNNITYWAPFANEPSVGQRVNAEIDDNGSENYKNKTYSSVGETATYMLRASRNIKKGDEILWYYGDGYDRDYKVGNKR